MTLPMIADRKAGMQTTISIWTRLATGLNRLAMAMTTTPITVPIGPARTAFGHENLLIVSSLVLRTSALRRLRGPEATVLRDVYLLASSLDLRGRSDGDIFLVFRGEELSQLRQFLDQFGDTGVSRVTASRLLFMRAA